MPFETSERPRFSILEKLCLAGSVALLLVAVGITTLLNRHYQDKFFPGVSIDGIAVGGRTQQEVKQLLLEKENTLPTFSLTLNVDGIEVASSGAELGGHYDYAQSIEQAFAEGRHQPLPEKVWSIISPWPKQVAVESTYTLEKELLRKQINVIGQVIDNPAEEPSAVLPYSGSAGSLKLLPGRSGRIVDRDATIQKVMERVQPGEVHVPVVVASVSAGLTPEQVDPAIERAKKFVGKKITLRADNIFKEMNDQLILSLLAFPEGVSATKIKPVADELAKEVDRPPQDALFSYDPETLQVTEFSPPRMGLGLNVDQFTEELKKKVAQLESGDISEVELALTVQETAPEKSLADTNTLGIKERIGFGESQYAHSIPNRVHNVALTSNKMNNFIIKPGEEFSFNKALGEVSARTGFKSAYVIVNGRTELGDGGGVCQVSTTLFRSVLDAGLKVTKRRPHSYRVSYYEQNAKPGIDATVYSGDVDLRFVNDTGHHILIHNQADSEKLYMTVEIYGTSDGRVTEIVEHKVWDQRPAPPPLYIDDPSLAPGKTRQIDFATSGVKASFKNIIKDKDGNLIREDEYYSNYVPWRAVFLRGV